MISDALSRNSESQSFASALSAQRQSDYFRVVLKTRVRRMQSSYKMSMSIVYHNDRDNAHSSYVK